MEFPMSCPFSHFLSSKSNQKDLEAWKQTLKIENETKEYSIGTKPVKLFTYLENLSINYNIGKT